jgi:hypothetical protein
MNQSSQHNHRHTDNPDHLQEPHEAIIGIERNSKFHDRHFEHDQPKPARDQKPRQLLFAFAARPLEVGARSREKHKHRSAKMRDPAR